MAPKVPSSEIGTATAGTSVARALRRNRNTTRITSEMATMSVRSTSCSEARMVVVRSIATFMSMSDGIEALSCGMSAVTRSTVVDDVGARLAVEDDEHRRLAVGEPEVAHVLDRVEHLRHIRQAHRVAVAVGDDEVAVLRRLGRLVVGVDLVALGADVDRALRAYWRWRRRARRARPPVRCRT